MCFLLLVKVIIHKALTTNSPCFAAFPIDAVFMCNQLHLGLRVTLRNLPW